MHLLKFGSAYRRLLHLGTDSSVKGITIVTVRTDKQATDSFVFYPTATPGTDSHSLHTVITK